MTANNILQFVCNSNFFFVYELQFSLSRDEIRFLKRCFQSETASTSSADFMTVHRKRSAADGKHVLEATTVLKQRNGLSKKDILCVDFPVHFMW